MSIAGTPLPVFIGLIVILCGGAAFLAGQALAETWRPLWQAVPAALALAATGRFLDYALFQGDLLSAPAAAIAAFVTLLSSFIAWRLRRVQRMVTQYPWLHERAGPFFWRTRQP